MLDFIPSISLRRILIADALASAACGALMAFGAGWLAEPFGLPAALLRQAGLLLLPFAALVAYAGLRRTPPRPLVWLIVVANALWVLDSAALLLSGRLAPTLLGEAFVIAQALAVALLAELEFFALRRTAALAA
jgi:hypothetical protein